MTYLLDTNVLIALLDASHVRHDDAHLWFAKAARMKWATCPLTENGVLRIMGATRYPNTPGPPSVIAQVVVELCKHPGHKFWPDSVSLLRSKRLNLAQLSHAGQVTDTYLLALAQEHGGKLATFDRRLVTNAVVDGKASLHLID